MDTPPKTDDRQEWTPDKYIQILGDALDDYENAHPHWRIEVLVSFIQGSLRSLRHYIEDCQDSEVSWESPFVELRYPVDWNWESPRIAKTPGAVHSGLHLGSISKQNTADRDITAKTLSEIMVRRLNTLALGDFTNGAWFEIHNNYSTPILPAQLSEQLRAIKGKRAQREFFEQIVRPFSIGAALIDYEGTDFRAGARVPKRVAKQLANIGNLIDVKRIGISGEINGRRVEMSLVFQVHPLVANYDEKKAYHAITVGLAIAPRIVGNKFVEETLSDWPKADREILWRELLEEIDKIKDQLIPKPESQNSKIFLVNAQLEMTVDSADPQARNAAMKAILENLSKAGQVQQIRVQQAGAACEPAQPPEPPEFSNEQDKAPATPTEGLLRLIWNSRLRWPVLIILALLIGGVALFGVLPDETKLEILKRLGLR